MSLLSLITEELLPEDIDFFINPDPDKANIVIEVLNAFGFGEVGFTQGDFIKPDQVIQMGHEPHPNT